MKRYAIVIAYRYHNDPDDVSFAHSFCYASGEDYAYDSIELLDLENKLLEAGHQLLNSYVLEVPNE